MFGSKLREIRKEKHLTLDQLAQMYNDRFNGGLNKGTLSKYENGKQEPLSSVIVNLAMLLNVSVDYLMDWEPATPEELEQWDREFNPGGKLAKEVKLIEDVESQWGKPAVEMMELFTSLNDRGQKKAIDNVTDLTMIERYKKSD